MNEKLQDLLMHNDKVKDECLKKVLVYKDKYQDYKQKVKLANQQITVLTQRVARYEMDRGVNSAQGISSKNRSPDKGMMNEQQQMQGHGSDDYIDYPEYDDEDNEEQ